jgi:hypothetical protein
MLVFIKIVADWMPRLRASCRNLTFKDLRPEQSRLHQSRKGLRKLIWPPLPKGYPSQLRAQESLSG